MKRKKIKFLSEEIITCDLKNNKNIKDNKIKGVGNVNKII